MDWFEGLVPRENAGDVELVRADFWADMRNEPRHGIGEPRPMVLVRVRQPLFEGCVAAQLWRAATLSGFLARKVFLAWGFKP